MPIMFTLRAFIILILTIFGTASFALESQGDGKFSTSGGPAAGAYDDNKMVGIDPYSTSPNNVPGAPFGDTRRRAEKVTGKCDLHGKKDAPCDKSQCKPDENCMSGKRGGCQMRKNVGGYKKPYACTLCRCIIR